MIPQLTKKPLKKKKDQKVPEGGLLSHPLRTGRPRLGPRDRVSVHSTRSLCGREATRTEEGMKDEIFPHTQRCEETGTISAMPVWVNTAGVFFEQSGPFDSHLNKIQIEGAEHTNHLPEKATVVSIPVHTRGRMGWVRIAERRAPSWANSSISVPLRLLPDPTLFHIYAFTPLPKTHDNSNRTLTLENIAVKNESYLVWNSWSHL